ncbi:MAG TPA: hypothetical protein VLK58_04285 [Conexibacter sp.]|nr:hypothetical protein [Conexibacter sp.]
MPNVRLPLLSTAVAALAVAALAPAAEAALPTFRDRTIVIGKSIGGVALGATAASAKAAWGRARGLCDEATCFYRPGDGRQSTGGEGSFSFTPKVVRIELKAPLASGRAGYAYRAPFTTPKTDKGIGIGSTPAAVKRAYPAARAVRGSPMLQIVRGQISTLFTYHNDDRRVFSITIEKLDR